LKEAQLKYAELFLFAQHGRTLTGASPECDLVAVNT